MSHSESTPTGPTEGWVLAACGPLPLRELGQTLVHEHVSTADWSLRSVIGDAYFDRDETLTTAVQQFAKAAALGVRTVVDGTPVNSGRDAELIREVSLRTGLNFIVSTGFYFHEETWIRWGEEAALHDFLSRECEEGISATGIRPGFLKAATADHGLTPALARAFRAIARVAVEQGLPVFVHHHPMGGHGHEIIDLFEDCGASPAQLVMGHSGDTNDLRYLESLLARGCYLGLDRFGHAQAPTSTNSLSHRVATLISLWRAGHGRQLLLSHDSVSCGGLTPFRANIPADTRSAADFTVLHTSVRPAWLEAGLLADDFEALLVENPRTLLATAQRKRGTSEQ